MTLLPEEANVKAPETMEMPEPYASAEAKYTAMDRKYFEEHPRRTNYVREATPFEWPQEIDAPYVHVIQAEPGCRFRVPMYSRTQVSKAATDSGMSVRDFAFHWLRNHAKAPSAEEVRRMYTKHGN